MVRNLDATTALVGIFIQVHIRALVEAMVSRRCFLAAVKIVNIAKAKACLELATAIKLRQGGDVQSGHNLFTFPGSHICDSPGSLFFCRGPKKKECASEVGESEEQRSRRTARGGRRGIAGGARSRSFRRFPNDVCVTSRKQSLPSVERPAINLYVRPRSQQAARTGVDLGA